MKSPLSSHTVPAVDLTSRPVVTQAVANRLEIVLAQAQDDAKGIGQPYEELLISIQAMIRRGGKRLRPLLVVWAYAGLGGVDQSAAIRVAAAQELYHAGILMHDDIIDRDLTRWNGPNISGRYVKAFAVTHSHTQARHLADGYALLAGDCCIDLAYSQVLHSGFSAPRLTKALALMHSTFFQMLGGELLDVHVSQLPAAAVRPEMLFDICGYKTSLYSFCLPLELGAILASAPAKTLLQVRQLGKWIGLAYQLQDDVLGMFGDPAQTGKPVISDLREGKRTLLMQYAYQMTDQAGRQTLDRWLGNKAVDQDGLAQVRDIIQTSGAQHQIEQTIAECYGQAEFCLAGIDWQAPYNRLLSQLFQDLLGRSA